MKYYCMFIIMLFALTIHASDLGDRDPARDMEFVFVKGGCFEMGAMSEDGDQRPVHTVCVKNFYIGKYEITQKQWLSIMEDNPSFFKKGGNYPVEHITFYDIQVFIEKLKQLTGRPYRLPTEAEWEYAARSGGKKLKYAGTNKDAELQNYAWFGENSGYVTHPVGQKMPNELGLYDMSGNVWEWVSDWYDAGYYRTSPRNNPQGPDAGEQRVLRGGSWFSEREYLHVSNRGKAGPVARYSGICGLRLAISSD